jgi:ABC-type lipoprotein release transport system permease subunit
MRNWIERQKNIIDFTLSSLFRRKGKNAALLAVYVLVVFCLASVMFFTHAIKREALFILKEAPEMTIQRLSAGRHDLIPLAYIDTLRKIRGVSSVTGRLWGYYYDPAAGANYTLMVPEVSPPESETIVIGKGVSRARQIYPGDMLSFKAHDGGDLIFEIRETLSAESELVSSDLILLSEEDFRRLFGIAKGYATDLTLRVKNPQELSTIARKVVQLFPAARPISREEIIRTYDTVFDWREGIMIVILSGALMAFIIFAWDKASGLNAEEKKEIGILKAIGWETADVLLMKFWEGAAISLTAFLLGVIFAYLHVFFASASLLAPVLKGWGTLYPDFTLTPFVNPYQIATLFFFTVVPYTVATIVPSWRAATIDPDSVMRT